MAQFGNVFPTTGEWECAECGYVEEGVRGRRPQECPECGAPGAAFEYFAYDEDDDEWELDDELDELDDDDDDVDDDDDFFDADEEDDY